MRPGGDQPVIADQIVGQAQAARADGGDEAAGQGIEIAEDAALDPQVAAIGFHFPAIDRHAGSGVGLGVGGKVCHQRVDRSGRDLGIAVEEDDGILRAGEQVMDEMVPGARLAAGGDVMDDHMGASGGGGAGTRHGAVGGAVHQHMEDGVRAVERQRAEAAGDPAFLLMGEDGDGDGHGGISGSPSPAGHARRRPGHRLRPGAWRAAAPGSRRSARRWRCRPAPRVQSRPGRSPGRAGWRWR